MPKHMLAQVQALASVSAERPANHHPGKELTLRQLKDYIVSLSLNKRSNKRPRHSEEGVSIDDEG